jgi:hypothetical protein
VLGTTSNQLGTGDKFARRQELQHDAGCNYMFYPHVPNGGIAYASRIVAMRGVTIISDEGCVDRVGAIDDVNKGSFRLLPLPALA